MHDWEEMQHPSDSSTERVKQHRKRLKDKDAVSSNVSSNVSETVQIREDKRREETETEEGREVVVKELPVNNLPATNNRPPPSLSIEEKDKRMTLELFNSLSSNDRQDFEVYYRKYHHTQEPRWKAIKIWFQRNMKDKQEQEASEPEPVKVDRGETIARAAKYLSNPNLTTEQEEAYLRPFVEEDRVAIQAALAQQL